MQTFDYIHIYIYLEFLQDVNTPTPSSDGQFRYEETHTDTVVSKIIGPLEFLPLDPMLNKPCNIERCGYKIHQIVVNMMLSLYLELKGRLLAWPVVQSG